MEIDNEKVCFTFDLLYMQITRPATTFDDRRIGLLGKFQEPAFAGNPLLR